MSENENTGVSAHDGLDDEYVTLISKDDHKFVIKKKHAMVSNTIAAMLSGPGWFQENQTNVIHFRDIESHVLAIICQYFMYKIRYDNSTTEIPEFPIPLSMSLDILMAANFLDC